MQCRATARPVTRHHAAQAESRGFSEPSDGPPTVASPLPPLPPPGYPHRGPWGPAGCAEPAFPGQCVRHRVPPSPSVTCTAAVLHAGPGRPTHVPGEATPGPACSVLLHNRGEHPPSAPGTAHTDSLEAILPISGCWGLRRATCPKSQPGSQPVAGNQHFKSSRSNIRDAPQRGATETPKFTEAQLVLEPP